MTDDTVRTDTVRSGAVRIAAACVCKDSADILPLLVAHYIRHGIRDFYIAFHGDDPAVSDALVASLGGLANFTVFHHNNPIFHQAAITNMLLELARADGCDVFVPFDSDEFYEPTDTSRSLVDVLHEWVTQGRGEQILVPMYNYFSPRDTQRFTSRTLARMTHRIDMKRGIAKDDLNSRFWWLYKSISRLRDIPKASITNVVIGNHQTLRGREDVERSVVDTPREPTLPDEFDLVIRHIPWRSREFTMKPLLMDRALITSVRSGEGLNDAQLAQLFADTWDAYTLDPDIDPMRTIETETYFLVPDSACARILHALDEVGFDIDDPWMRPRPNSAITKLTARNDGAPTYVSRVTVDDPGFDAGVLAANVQLTRAYQERDFHRDRWERRDERIKRLESRVQRLTEQRDTLRKNLARVLATRAERQAVPVIETLEKPSPSPSRKWAPLAIARRLRNKLRRVRTRS